jgi:hypothetical protein
VSGTQNNQAEFEQWLLLETSAKARIVRLHEARNQDDYRSWMVAGQLDMLLIALGRYADRNPITLREVAHDDGRLRELVRNGRSMAAEARQTYLDYTCRGCDGTCCTGVGSDPCTCPPPRDPDDDK